MPELARQELLGKEKRVLGVFVLMLGAGIVLETSVRWLGAVLLLSGAACLVWGALDLRPRRRARPEADLLVNAPAESHR